MSATKTRVPLRKSILDRSFTYTPSHATNVGARLAEIVKANERKHRERARS